MRGAVRQCELVAAFARAADLGMGQPLDHTLRTCLVAIDVARTMRLSEEDLRDTYYFTLLRFIGCTSHATEDAAETGGDEIAWRGSIAPVLSGTPGEFMGNVLRHLGEGLPRATRARLIAAFVRAGAKAAARTIAANCEVAQMFAGRIGAPASVVDALGYSFEHYNGKGLPRGAAGEEIPIAVRIGAVARDAEVLHRTAGWETAEAMLEDRGGRSYDSSVVRTFLERGRDALDGLPEAPWDPVIDADPLPHSVLSGPQLLEALTALGDFSDLKCTFTRGHSHAVARLGAGAASILTLDEGAVEQAALFQETGKTAIPNGILEKPGSLTPPERERVRLHPYLTEQVMTGVRGLAAATRLAACHHERLDGSGYPSGMTAPDLPAETMVLAAADVYVALTGARPWRGPHTPDDAARELREEAKANRLAADAVEAVLETAGAPGPVRAAWPAQLSDREVDVLRRIARGLSNRDVARELVISPKTVGRHIENIYAKTGVSSRAAATLFAVQNDLIAPDGMG